MFINNYKNSFTLVGRANRDKCGITLADDIRELHYLQTPLGLNFCTNQFFIVEVSAQVAHELHIQQLVLRVPRSAVVEEPAVSRVRVKLVDGLPETVENVRLELFFADVQFVHHRERGGVEGFLRRFGLRRVGTFEKGGVCRWDVF